LLCHKFTIFRGFRYAEVAKHVEMGVSQGYSALCILFWGVSGMQRLGAFNGISANPLQEAPAELGKPVRKGEIRPKVSELPQQQYAQVFFVGLGNFLGGGTDFVAVEVTGAAQFQVHGGAKESNASHQVHA